MNVFKINGGGDDDDDSSWMDGYIRNLSVYVFLHWVSTPKGVKLVCGSSR